MMCVPGTISITGSSASGAGACENNVGFAGQTYPPPRLTFECGS
jgi:hypothetical protein